MINFSETKSIGGRDYVPLDEVLAYIEGLKEHQNIVAGAINGLNRAAASGIVSDSRRANKSVILG